MKKKPITEIDRTVLTGLIGEAKKTSSGLYSHTALRNMTDISINTSTATLWTRIKRQNNFSFLLSIGATADCNNLYYITIGTASHAVKQMKVIFEPLKANTLTVMYNSEYIYIKRAYGGGICSIIPVSLNSEIESDSSDLPSDAVSLPLIS